MRYNPLEFTRVRALHTIDNLHKNDFIMAAKTTALGA